MCRLDSQSSFCLVLRDFCQSTSGGSASRIFGVIDLTVFLLAGMQHIPSQVAAAAKAVAASLPAQNFRLNHSIVAWQRLHGPWPGD